MISIEIRPHNHHGDCKESSLNLVSFWFSADAMSFVVVSLIFTFSVNLQPIW
jgi:hypothetical protein